MPLNYQNLVDKSLNKLIQIIGQKIYDYLKNKNPKWYERWKIWKDIKELTTKYAKKLSGNFIEKTYDWYIEKDGNGYILSTDAKRLIIKINNYFNK